MQPRGKMRCRGTRCAALAAWALAAPDDAETAWTACDDPEVLLSAVQQFRDPNSLGHTAHIFDLAAAAIECFDAVPGAAESLPRSHADALAVVRGWLAAGDVHKSYEILNLFKLRLEHGRFAAFFHALAQAFYVMAGEDVEALNDAIGYTTDAGLDPARAAAIIRSHIRRPFINDSDFIAQWTDPAVGAELLARI